MKGLFLETIKIPFHVLKIALNLVREWSRSQAYEAGLELVSTLIKVL